jgi:hypothetical protein
MKWLAIWIMNRIVGDGRNEWSLAMRREFDELQSGHLGWATGCLWTTVQATVTAGSALLSAARWTLVVGAMAWSALHIRLAVLLSASGANTPSILAYVAAAAIALGAFLTAIKGLRAAAILAAPVAVSAGLVAIDIDKLMPRSSFIDFYRAIAIEYVVILLVAMLIATGVPRWIKLRERPIR